VRAAVVSNLLTFARQHPPQRTTTFVNDVVSSVLEMRRYALTVHGVELEASDASPPAIWADPFSFNRYCSTWWAMRSRHCPVGGRERSLPRAKLAADGSW
jgi:hypothetical protein